MKIYHQYGNIFHLGFKKLSAQIKDLFLIPNLHKIYKNIVDVCEFCQLHMNKPTPRNILGTKMYLGRSSTTKFWHLDYIIIDSSFQEFPAILTVTDINSGFTLFLPANDKWQSDKFISVMIEHVFKIHGFPLAISTDRQKSLISGKVQEFAKLFNVKLFSALGPQANRSEYLHSLLLKILRLLSSHWKISEKNIGIFCSLSGLALNSLRIGRNKLTPNQIVFNDYSLPRTAFQAYIGRLDEGYNADIVQLQRLKEFYWSLEREVRVINAERRGVLKDYLKKFTIGSFVLLKKRRPTANMAGWKMRAKFYDQVFQIVRLMTKNVIIVPALTAPKKVANYKGYGRLINQKYLMVVRNRLKLVTDQYRYNSWAQQRRGLERLAQIIASQPIYKKIKIQLHQPDQKSGLGQPGSLQKFVDVLKSPGLLDYPVSESLRKNADKIRALQRRFSTFQDEEDEECEKKVLIFTHEKLIEINTKICTCSYGRTTSFVRHHQCHQEVPDLQSVLENKDKEIDDCSGYTDLSQIYNIRYKYCTCDYHRNITGKDEVMRRRKKLVLSATISDCHTVTNQLTRTLNAMIRDRHVVNSQDTSSSASGEHEVLSSPLDRDPEQQPGAGEGHHLQSAAVVEPRAEPGAGIELQQQHGAVVEDEEGDENVDEQEDFLLPNVGDLVGQQEDEDTGDDEKRITSVMPRADDLDYSRSSRISLESSEDEEYWLHAGGGESPDRAVVTLGATPKTSFSRRKVGYSSRTPGRTPGRRDSKRESTGHTADRDRRLAPTFSLSFNPVPITQITNLKSLKTPKKESVKSGLSNLERTPVQSFATKSGREVRPTSNWAAEQIAPRRLEENESEEE